MDATLCDFVDAGRPHAHTINPGNRRLGITFTAAWGIDDLRADHVKSLTFCSFECLSKWAAERALQHDGKVVQEGT